MDAIKHCYVAGRVGHDLLGGAETTGPDGARTGATGKFCGGDNHVKGKQIAKPVSDGGMARRRADCSGFFIQSPDFGKKSLAKLPCGRIIASAGGYHVIRHPLYKENHNVSNSFYHA
jgi:hypothetical protein